MANSPQLPIFAVNSTVKAWCNTALLNWTESTTITSDKWDAKNFIDGYNLRLDMSNNTANGIVLGAPTVYGKALKFSFITPMRDTKYKIFIQASCQISGKSGKLDLPSYAHALNSAQFPKLTTSFWIRVGSPSTANQVSSVTFNGSADNIIRVVVL